MAGSMTDWGEAAILNYLFAGSTTPKAANYYVGLWTQALSDTSTGVTAGEVSGNGYARATIEAANTAWNWATASVVDNRLAVTFAAPSGDWGTVTHGGLCDAATEGNMLYWWDWTASKIIQSGDTVTIAAGALDVGQG